MKITEKKAIEIANEEAIKLGYDIKSMDIKITKYNTPWNEYIPKDSKSEYIIERLNKLKNKEYWAVYYYYDFKKIGMIYKGGDLCIFVDAKTGEIITTYRGK